MKFLSSDFWIVTGSFLSISALSIFLYQDFNKSVSIKKSEIIGNVIFKNNSAKRKQLTTVVWDQLEQNSPIANKDTIHTGKNSEAIILLNDKTKIELGENSMIYLDFSKRQVNIKFAFGTLNAKRSGMSNDQKLLIQTNNSTIAAQNSDLKIAQESGKDMQLTVENGNASVNINGKEQNVGQNQVASFSGDSMQVKKIYLSPTQPLDGQYFITFDPAYNIAFRWKKTDIQSAIRLEVSRRRDFKNQFIRRELKNTTIALKIPEGIYYWRISALDKDKKRNYSTVQRFSVVQDARIQLLYPNNNAVISYFNDKPLLSFSWRKNNLASRYTLFVAKDKAFQTQLKRVDVNSTSIALDNLQDGQYFWKVRANNNIEAWPAHESSINQFSIRKKRQIPAPAAISPVNNKNLPMIAVRKNGILFTWQGDREISQYVFQLSRDNTFQNPIVNQKTSKSFIQIGQTFQKNQYHWRVAGIYGQNQQTAFSKIQNFQISQTSKIVLVAPQTNLQFEQNKIQQKGLSFSWQRLTGIDADYIFELSQTKNFQNTLIKQKVSSNIFKINDLAPGRYYWRTSFAGGNQDSSLSLQSTVRQFQVLANLGAPTIVFPNDRTLDLAKDNQIRFEWKKVTGASLYELMIYRIRGGSPKQIWSTKTKNNQVTFTQFKTLDVGNFSWAIKALRTDKTGKVSARSSAARAPFSIVYTKEINIPKLEIPDEIFVE